MLGSKNVWSKNRQSRGKNSYFRDRKLTCHFHLARQSWSSSSRPITPPSKTPSIKSCLHCHHHASLSGFYGFYGNASFAWGSFSLLWPSLSVLIQISFLLERAGFKLLSLSFPAPELYFCPVLLHYALLPGRMFLSRHELLSFRITAFVIPSVCPFVRSSRSRARLSAALVCLPCPSVRRLPSFWPRTPVRRARPSMDSMNSMGAPSLFPARSCPWNVGQKEC